MGLGSTLNRTLKVTIVGDARGGVKATDDMSSAANRLSRGMTTTGSAAGGAMSNLRRNVAFAGVAVAAFAGSSVSKFQEVAKQAIQVQKYVGGTAEGASRLAFAARESGLDVDSFSKGLGIMNKHLVAGDPAWKALGINARDAHGKLLPMDQLLPEISQKFADMKSGPEKTALAMKLFGKAGVGMLPFLNKGKEGIAELEKESDKLGYTMSAKATKSVIEQGKAQRKLKAEMEAVQFQIGKALLPVVTALTKIFIEVLAPIVKTVTDLMGKHKTIVLIVAAALGALLVTTKLHSAALAIYRSAVLAISIATRIWAGVQAAFNIIMSLNPIALVVIAIIALIAIVVLCYKKFAWFRDAIAAIWNVLKTIFTVALYVIGIILLGPIAVLIILYKKFAWFRDAVKGIFGGIANLVTGFIGIFKRLPGQLAGFFGGMWDGLKSGFKAAINFVIGIWNSFAKGMSFKLPPWLGGHKFGLPQIPKLKNGGTIASAGATIVGDAGPELLNLPTGARVTPLPKGGSGGSRGGDVYNVSLTVHGSVHTENDLVQMVTKGIRNAAVRSGGTTALLGRA
jgi:hypothetical protein